MVNKIQYMLGLCAMAVLTLGSSAAQSACPDAGQYPSNGCSLPGLVGGSFPYFTQGVDVKLNSKDNGDFSFKASYGGSGTSEFWVDQNNSYSIDNTFFQFKANAKHGDVVDGSVRIMGNLGGKPGRQTLMTADLTGVWDYSGGLIGFNTMNIQCGDAILVLVNCTSSEVIYFSLQDALVPGGMKGKFETTGLAVTSVPVPAAVWLFGSGLVGLIGVSRRKRT